MTIQAQILDLMRDLRERLGTAVILITHDLGVIAEMADRVAVMYAGRIVEQADVNALFENPLHPYTQGLIGSIPVLGRVTDNAGCDPGHRCRTWSTCRRAAGLPRAAGRACSTTCQICTRGRARAWWKSVPGHDVRCWLYVNHDGHGPAITNPYRRGSP